MWYLYILCAALAAALIIYIIYFNKAKNEQFKKWKENYQKQLENDFSNLRTSIGAKQLELKTIEQDINSKTKFNSQLKKMREEELDRLMEEERENRLYQIDVDVQDWAESAQEIATRNYNHLVEEYDDEINIKKEQVKYLITQLAEQQSKVDAMNKEILRRRAIDEKNEFYSIQISDAVKEDIAILNEVRPRLSNVEIFNKFIYDNYIGKPTKEMVQRVLGGRNPSGIYKVSNIDTHEAYIGKSVKVADRWQNHVKAAAGLGGVAESQFQRALKKYGVDKFTWELVEEVGKDELTNREKYWIQFYGTKEYGYNQREG